MMTKQNMLQTFLLALFASSGPVAKWLSVHYGLDNPTIEMILNVGTLATPLLASGAYAFAMTVAGLVARIKAMPTSQQAQVVSAMPIETRVAAVATLTDSDAAKVAAVLPDKTVVSAAGSIDGVNVRVAPTASPGALAAANDPSVAGVNPI